VDEGHIVMPMSFRLAAVLVLLPTAAPISAQAPPVDARSEIVDPRGDDRGPRHAGGDPEQRSVTAAFSDLPPGPHAFHVHEVGQCEPPFESAGTREFALPAE
jgi:Cu-Zn family superoxide dismutase